MTQYIQQSKEGAKLYEVGFLSASPDISDSVAAILERAGAEIVHPEPAKQFQFAYTIKKHDSGFFGFLQFRAAAETVMRIKKELESTHDILKFLFIKDPVTRVRGEVPVDRDGSHPQSHGEEAREGQSGSLTNEALEAKLEEILK